MKKRNPAIKHPSAKVVAFTSAGRQTIRDHSAFASSRDQMLDRYRDGVLVGCDTEFQGAHTLTQQFATRWKNDFVVLVQRSPSIPVLPAGLDLSRDLPKGIWRWCNRIIVREVDVIDRSFSPAAMLSKLLGITPAPQVATAPNVHHTALRDLRLTLVGHYLSADALRLFGERFYHDRLLPSPNGEPAPLTLVQRKTIRFADHGGSQHFRPPVADAWATSKGTIDIRLATFDTNLPYGSCSLDELSKALLGISKTSLISECEKPRMRRTFRDKPEFAYAYAILDAILPLLVREQMEKQDKQIYASRGYAMKDIPNLRPTLGSRAATLIKADTCRLAAGSTELAKSKNSPTASKTKVAKLMTRGSATIIGSRDCSRFGEQTGDVHGGLNYSRSPFTFTHLAPGQLRDVDLSGCYGSIINNLTVYFGQPIVLEPGDRRTTAAQAISCLKKNAAGDDAWFIKVSGKIEHFPNTLIPSTTGALTTDNYRRQSAKARSKSERQAKRDPDSGRTAIFTDVIESGIIARPTWLIIQALPPAWRKEYENLVVDSIVFYPKKLVARTVAEYDALCRQFRGSGCGWKTRLDLGTLTTTTDDQLDERHVSLAFDIGDLSRYLSEERRRARTAQGQGSAAERALKCTINALCGVLASRHLDTGNVVAANCITATGRALAFTQHLSLNGIQVITDGCTYRADQIPAVPLSKCLRQQPEYPICRAEAGIPFVPAASVPTDDADFTKWYRIHAMRFLGVTGPNYERLFGLHSLEHKRCGDSQVAFDGLCCDGGANYIKLAQKGATWSAIDFKARSFHKDAKKVLSPYLIDVFTNDRYSEPSPITRSGSLMTLSDATKAARTGCEHLSQNQQKTNGSPVRVVLPLGFRRDQVQVYRIIKLSAFVFRNPSQKKAFQKAISKYEAKHGVGIELLALRRSSAGREVHSIAAVARQLDQAIRRGDRNPTKALNLTRPFLSGTTIGGDYEAHVEQARQKTLANLADSINAAKLDASVLRTGLILTKQELEGLA